MIVALTILVGAGFVFLYCKSELDAQQTSNEIGIIRSLLTTKARLDGLKTIQGQTRGSSFEPPFTKEIEVKEDQASSFNIKEGETVKLVYRTSTDTVFTYLSLGPIDPGSELKAYVNSEGAIEHPDGTKTYLERSNAMLTKSDPEGYLFPVGLRLTQISLDHVSLEGRVILLRY